MSVDFKETIGHYMQRALQGVSEDTSVLNAVSLMAARRIGSLVVHPAGQESQRTKIIGLISETDLIRLVIAKDLNAAGTNVGQIMASPLLSIPSDRTMLDASHFMEKHGIRHLCVTEGEAVVGLISVRDLVKHFVYAEKGPIRDLDDVYRPLSVLMRRDIETIDREATLITVAQRMTDKRIGALMVTQAGEMVGIVTERDLIYKGMAQNRDLTQARAGSVMTQALIDIDINRTVHDASDLMAEKNIRHLPITENHAIVGILSVRDLMRMISVRDRPRFLNQQS
ncbi:CBS domain-containing protein [Candidatus Nitrospira allomarina]|uniref:CBS domain-containing protein n=1 Tax=Candidatus Nitrospira allomarina TaxID=3020900 RepID=A0AA96JYE8_9BACT|nr:CBS domain-containing protein [Candidatus Nitrospira allomarina]WNM57464.1 CBS domain-containing protein [Candidatus Nitrospira allomarina]